MFCPCDQFHVRAPSQPANTSRAGGWQSLISCAWDLQIICSHCKTANCTTQPAEDSTQVGKKGNFSPLTAQYQIKWEITTPPLSFVCYTQTQAGFSATWRHHFQPEVSLSCPRLLCANLELCFQRSMAITKMP